LESIALKAFDLKAFEKLWFGNRRSRHQKVKVGNITSEPLPIKYGVPQGSVLGPLLFTIYINELPDSINDPNCFSIMYADDTSIYAFGSTLEEAIATLEKQLINAAKWLGNNSLKLNGKKSQIMYIGPKTAKLEENLPAVNVNGTSIDPQQSIKLLGVQVDNRLNFEEHAENMRAKVRSASYALRLAGQNGIPFDGRKAIYNSLVNSRLSYCDILFNTGSARARSILDKAQHQAIRALMMKDNSCSVKEMLCELRWLTLEGRRTVHELKLVYQCLHKEAPQELVDLFRASTTKNSALRSAANGSIQATESEGTTQDRTFRIRGSKAWRAADKFIRKLTSSTGCRKAAYLQQFFVEQVEPWTK